MLEKGINSPVTSSAGRLFDGVAGLLGIRDRNEFEGQAAMELEFTVTEAEGDRFDAQVVDDEGKVFMNLLGYRTMEMPDPVSAELLAPLKDIMK